MILIIYHTTITITITITITTLLPQHYNITTLPCFPKERGVPRPIRFERLPQRGFGDGFRPSECDDVIKRAYVSRSRGLPHREVTDGFLVAKGDFRPAGCFPICLLRLRGCFAPGRRCRA